jgi:uncharacterized repeat protein (TIGR03803 family)
MKSILLLAVSCVAGSGAFAQQVAPPSFSPSGGVYSSAQTVAMTSATSGASIAYTTDGSLPTESGGTVTHGLLYSGAVSIDPTTILSAMAFKPDYPDSGVQSEGYTLPPVAAAFGSTGDLPALASDATFLPAVSTPTLNVLFSFSSASNGGITPVSTLAQGTDGNFYGTTNLGGAGNNGSLFVITPTGALTTLVSFAGTNGDDPIGGLIQGTDGNFYGTANGGGASSDGTLFKMTPAGVLTTLVTFTGPNGQFPSGNLIQATDGNFYGTVYNGGSSSQGTVFKMTPAGVLTTLVSFTVANGAGPEAGLVQGTDGNFYGTTAFGGVSNDGTVFKMTPAGVLTTLVSFTGTSGLAPGTSPEAGLVQGPDGNFYGTTHTGGGSNLGTIFKVTPAGVLTTLFTFLGDANGSNPRSTLVVDGYGNFYGTAETGGTTPFDGTLFEMSPAGVLTTLVAFVGPNGGFPDSGVIQGTDGNFYGTTINGGTAGDGVVYQLVIPPAAAPSFSLAAGVYTSAQTVAITTATSGASIAYTTDGSKPTQFGTTVTHGTLYTGPVTIGSTATLNAIAFENGFNFSPVTSAVYTINVPVMPASSGGGGGGAFDDWFLAIVAFAGLMRWRAARR